MELFNSQTLKYFKLKTLIAFSCEIWYYNYNTNPYYTSTSILLISVTCNFHHRDVHISKSRTFPKG